jgi:SAM-dependent methyltransferase
VIRIFCAGVILSLALPICSSLDSPPDPVGNMHAAQIPFGEDLLPIQKEIAEADKPNDFYALTYSRAEPFYWLRIVEWMLADSKVRHAKRILDIGCGYGTLLIYASKLYRASGYCMDVTDYLKSQVRSKHNLQFVRANIELDPIPWSEKFDVILFTEVLEHLNFQSVPSLRKMRASLATGGRLYLSTPDQSAWGKQTKYYQSIRDLPNPQVGKKIIDDHIWIYSKAELTAAIQAAGFEIERLDYSPGVNGARHFNLVAIAH